MMSFPTSYEDNVTEQERSLFLGDLSCFCQDIDVYQFFRGVGEIETVRIMRDKTTNKCSGYGFITFVDKNALPIAIRLDGQVLLGRRVKIGLAKPRKPLTSASIERTVMMKEMNPLGHLKPRDNSKPPAQLHFSYLSQQIRYRVTEETIRNVFSRFGEVMDVTIKKAAFDGNNQSGYGFVHFALDYSGVEAAIRATSAITQVVIDDVLYDSCLSRSLEVALQSAGVLLQEKKTLTPFSTAPPSLKPNKLPISNERVHFSTYYPMPRDSVKESVHFPNENITTPSTFDRNISLIPKKETSAFLHSSGRVVGFERSHPIVSNVTPQGITLPSRNEPFKQISSFNYHHHQHSFSDHYSHIESVQF